MGGGYIGVPYVNMYVVLTLKSVYLVIYSVTVGWKE